MKIARVSLFKKSRISMKAFYDYGILNKIPI